MPRGSLQGTFVLTLWDLLKPAVARVVEIARPPAPKKAEPASRNGVLVAPARRKPVRGADRPAKLGMQEKYDAVVALMLKKYDVRVRKWRSSSSGIAWTIKYRDGRIVRLLESPKPKGPMSMAIFLHEIGHHAIGLGAFKPRCLEEYHAWMFSIRAMEEHGLNITDSVRTRMHRSLRYAVRKARRRGLRDLPPELAPYVEAPSARTSA
ncbi:MAG: hypothetical protein KF691_09725 [Phycisphaeraceae bacterium]|nr:hypothetical protein [Phycisphaeraceae bacterium]